MPFVDKTLAIPWVASALVVVFVLLMVVVFATNWVASYDSFSKINEQVALVDGKMPEYKDQHVYWVGVIAGILGMVIVKSVPTAYESWQDSHLY